MATKRPIAFGEDRRSVTLLQAAREPSPLPGLDDDTPSAREIAPQKDLLASAHALCHGRDIAQLANRWPAYGQVFRR